MSVPGHHVGECRVSCGGHLRGEHYMCGVIMSSSSGLGSEGPEKYVAIMIWFEHRLVKLLRDAGAEHV